MPAYFTMTVVYDLDFLDYDSLKITLKYMEDAGMTFRSGYWTSKDDTFDEIVYHDQKLLEGDYVPEPEDDVRIGYKQMLFDFGGFSEVRVAVRNHEPDEKSYCIDIYIPEEEIFEDGEGGSVYRTEAVDSLIALAKGIWLDPAVRVIETETESGSGAVPEQDIMVGKLPEAHPFAVISEVHAARLELSGFETEVLFPGGVVIRKQ